MAQKWDYSKHRGPGRAGIKPEISSLIVRMAPDNPKWGYARIQVARSLVDEEGRALTGTRYLIIDRETKYTPRFRELVERRATKAIGRQPGSPDFRGFSSHSIPGGESVRKDSISPCIA